MSYYVVAREEPLTVGNSNIKYEHNERKNLTYLNPDIDLTKENFYFKKPEKSYTAIFHEMEEKGLFSTRRIKLNDPHTKIGSEIIVAVAGDYFKTKEQAIEFFKVANEALNEFFTVTLPDGTTVNGSDLCISSVIHCDEANYGLHYVTTCCTAKELFKKRTKKQMAENKKPVSKGWYVQLSHSNFWDSHKNENGRLVYSYSILNDFVADAYKKAGYSEIERGKKGSTAKHLHPNDYKALMRRVEQEAIDSMEELEVKKIAGQYIMNEKTYERLLAAQEKMAIHQAAVDKAQELIDAQKKSIDEERMKVKKMEIEAERIVKLRSDVSVKYEEAVEKIKEQSQTIEQKDYETQNQLVIIRFWESVFEWLMDAIGRIINWIDELVHGNPSTSEVESIRANINRTYEDILYTIKNFNESRYDSMMISK